VHHALERDGSRANRRRQHRAVEPFGRSPEHLNDPSSTRGDDVVLKVEVIGLNTNGIDAVWATKVV